MLSVLVISFLGYIPTLNIFVDILMYNMTLSHDIYVKYRNGKVENSPGSSKHMANKDVIFQDIKGQKIHNFGGIGACNGWWK